MNLKDIEGRVINLVTSTISSLESTPEKKITLKSAFVEDLGADSLDLTELYTPHHETELTPSNEYPNLVLLKYSTNVSVATSMFSIYSLCVTFSRPLFQTCS